MVSSITGLFGSFVSPFFEKSLEELIQEGRIDEAIEKAKSISDPEQQLLSFKLVIENLIQNDNIEKAIEVASHFCT